MKSRQAKGQLRRAGIKVTRLEGNPIIQPPMLARDDGVNINGPSLIRTPAWLPNRLGKYYLYFAHHQGKYIRLAYADHLSGPWTIYAPGTLGLAAVASCRGHIASPDVHVDESARQIRMYFHGPVDHRSQRSFVATSWNGVDFVASPERLANAYLRMIPRGGEWIGLAMDGHFYRSDNGLSNFSRSPKRVLDFSQNPTAAKLSLRHLALRINEPHLEIYYTRRGDRPERIWRCLVLLTQDWATWQARHHEILLTPEFNWEGADLPVASSQKGMSLQREHAVRDPAIFVEDGRSYLLYAVAGEAGIAIAQLEATAAR